MSEPHHSPHITSHLIVLMSVNQCHINHIFLIAKYSHHFARFYSVFITFPSCIGESKFDENGKIWQQEQQITNHKSSIDVGTSGVVSDKDQLGQDMNIQNQRRVCQKVTHRPGQRCDREGKVTSSGRKRWCNSGFSIIQTHRCDIPNRERLLKSEV
jgi:hypothetical protein